jgi:carnitine 3-dehydrogenase
MSGFKNTAVLGAGVIGMSWTALFLASGRNVAVFDTLATAEKATRDYIEMAWPAIDALGLIKSGAPGQLTFHRAATEAVKDADFVQENVPERIEIKKVLFAEIEPALKPSAIVASSASGLTLGEMQSGWENPTRFVLGHPFNPPHLIPLVEVLANSATSAGVAEQAEDFYRDTGKVTIRVQREVPGHVANRLQAALWREALHLVKSGVASIEDVDRAVWAGPGLRWAAMGPTMLFHLGAGPGGIASFCERYTASFNR